MLLVGAVWARRKVVGCFTADQQSENKTQEADGYRGKQWGRAVSVMGRSPSAPTALLLSKPWSACCPGKRSWNRQGGSWGRYNMRHLWAPSFVDGRKLWADAAEMIQLFFSSICDSRFQPCLLDWPLVVHYGPEVRGSRASGRCSISITLCHAKEAVSVEKWTKMTKPFVTKTEKVLALLMVLVLRQEPGDLSPDFPGCPCASPCP